MTTPNSPDHSEIPPALRDRLGAGDRTAFREVVELYVDRLMRYVSRYVASQDRARETVGRVFQELWRRRSDLTVLRDLDEFLYATARQQALYGLRSRLGPNGSAPAPYVPPSISTGSTMARGGGGGAGGDPGEGDTASDIAAAVQRALDTLPPLEREALRHRGRDRAEADIAAALGVAPAEVGPLLERAVRQLAGALARQRATGA